MQDASPNPFSTADLILWEADFGRSGLVNTDFDEDGDTVGEDFLAWQRSESPNRLNTQEPAAWEAQYGTTNSIVSTSTSIP